MRDYTETVRTARARLASIIAGRTTRTAVEQAAMSRIIAAGGLTAVDVTSFGLLNSVEATESASITATDRTVTSPDNPWSADDVGKVFHMAGAGTAGGTLVAAIASVTSAGEIELTREAVTTVAASKTSASGVAAWGWPVDVAVLDVPVRATDRALQPSAVNSNDNTWLQAAIIRAELAGGGVVVIPPGMWDGGNVSVVGARVTIMGRGATLRNTRITASAACTDLALVGFRVLDDRSDGASYLLDISATRFIIDGVTLEKTPAAGGYQAYIRDVSSHGDVRGLRTIGSNGIYIAGHDHTFTACHLESNMSGGPGGDDGYVLKGLGQTYNITITGGTVRGHQAVLSIGSEVGQAGADGDYSKYVRNVSVVGVTAYNCACLCFIKPGALGSDYRHGLVENITLNDCTLADTNGFLYWAAVVIWAGRGAIVRGVQITDCIVRARGKSNVVTNAAVCITVKNLGAAATIEDIIVDDLAQTDTYDGVANAGPTPGYPIDWGVFVELENVGLGTIGRILVRDMFLRGTRIGGAYVGASVTGPVRFERPVFRKVAVTPPSSAAGGFYSGSQIGVYDADVEALNYRAVGGDLLTTTTYKGQKVTAHAGTFAAGNSGQCSVFVAPFDCYIHKVELTNNGAIAQSDTDYTTLEVRNLATGNVVATKTTKVTGGIAVPDDTAISLSATTIVGVNAYLPAGAVLRWSKTDTGAGRAVTNMNVTIHFVPYSR